MRRQAKAVGGMLGCSTGIRRAALRYSHARGRRWGVQMVGIFAGPREIVGGHEGKGHLVGLGGVTVGDTPPRPGRTP